MCPPGTYLISNGFSFEGMVAILQELSYFLCQLGKFSDLLFFLTLLDGDMKNSSDLYICSFSLKIYCWQVKQKV